MVSASTAVSATPTSKTTNATSQADACSLINPSIFGRTACNGIGKTRNTSVQERYFG